MSGVRFGKVDTSVKYENVVIVAGGPSAKAIDMSKLKWLDDSFIIAVNGSGSHVLFADAWFTLDPWGLHGPQLPKNFEGKLYAAVPQDYGTKFSRIEQHKTPPTADITYLHRLISHNLTSVSSTTAYVLGLSEDSRCISTGNSGYGALNFAYHMRPERIFILGLDGTIGYWYSTTEKNRELLFLPQMFDSAKEQLDSEGISVYNVNPVSQINTFEKIDAKSMFRMIDV